MKDIDKEINHAFVESNDIKLHIVYAGSTKNKMILFLHGFPECWYSWRYQLRYFSKEYLAVAPDLRGYNLSSKPKEKEKYRIKYLIDDTRSIIKYFNKSKAIIVGHDWGGVIAWWTAIKYPQVIDKLIILNAPHPGIWLNKVKFMPKQLRKSWYIFFFQLNDIPEEYFSYDNFINLRMTMKLTTYRKNQFSEDDINKFIECWRKDGSLKYMIDYYRVNLNPSEFMSFSKYFNFPSIKVPTLIIWGIHDFALEKNLVDGTEKYVENLKIIYIDDSGHWIQQEVPGKVNEEIKRFIIEN